ncbi:hypothetical protein [Citrobacter phage Tr1]|nr:hypothetical protein [Citrobacter phage Tr1]
MAEAPKDVIQKFARPEEIVEIPLDNDRTVTFRILKWSPTKVFERIPELGSVLAVPLVMFDTAKMSADEDLEARIAMALIQLFSGLEEKNLALFLRKILDEVYTESGHNVSENFDELFFAHPELVIDLTAKVLEVNYSPFFKRGFGKLLTQFQGIESLAKS